MAKNITITVDENELEYVKQALDDQYKSYKRRASMADMDDLKKVLNAAADRTEKIRHKLNAPV